MMDSCIACFSTRSTASRYFVYLSPTTKAMSPKADKICAKAGVRAGTRLGIGGRGE